MIAGGGSAAGWRGCFTACLAATPAGNESLGLDLYTEPETGLLSGLALRARLL